ncbi:MAG: hypothetical protein M3Y50_15545 [Acidobacteriota bacterium]|nr:hypothetical protein [Acidobacteriota bacterium]
MSIYGDDMDVGGESSAESGTVPRNRANAAVGVEFSTDPIVEIDDASIGFILQERFGRNGGVG